MKKKIKNRWKYYSLFMLFLIGFIIKNTFSVNIPDFFLISILILMVLFGDKDEIISTCILCIPLIMVIKCSYVVLIAVVCMLIKYRSQIKINLSIIPIIILLIWEVMHCFMGEFSLTSLIGLFIPFILCCLLMGQDLKGIDYELIVRSFALCTCIMCAVLLGDILVRSNYNLSVAFVNMQRLGISNAKSTKMSLTINPNTLGVVCILAMSGILQLFICKKNKTFDFFMVAVMVICGILTLSRTFIILLLFMLVLFLMVYKGSIRKKIKFFITLIFSSLVLIFFLNIFFQDAIDNIQARFLVKDISSGRNELFMKYNEFLFSSPQIMMKGLGATNFSKKVVEEYNIAKNVPHNGIQEMLIAWGIIGVIVVLWFWGLMFFDAIKKNKNIGLVNFIPLLLIVAKIQVGQLLTSDYTMLGLTFCYLSMSQRLLDTNTKVAECEN